MLVPLAHAAVLGEIQLRSALGERFNARINIVAKEGEELGLHCLRLIPSQSANAPHFSARLSFEPNENGGVLTLRGNEPLQEPLLDFSIRLRCPSETSASFQRDYNVLLDPREYRPRQSADLVPQAPVLQQNLPDFSGTWQSQEGDSVEQIARAYFPKDRASRKRMVDEIYRLNPAMAQQARARLPLNKDVKLPDRKHLLPRVSVMSEEKNLQLAVPLPVKESLQITASSLPHFAQNGFQLRLSESLSSISSKIPASSDEGLLARERLQLLDIDDQAAQLLQFKYQIGQLEKQLASLQGPPQVESPQAEKPQTKRLRSSSPVFVQDKSLNLPGAWWLLLLLLIPAFYLIWRRRNIVRADTDVFPPSSEMTSVPLSERPTQIMPDRSQPTGAMNHLPQAASGWGRDDVDVIQPKNVSEEAQMLLDHGLVTQAVDLLEDEIEHHPSSLALWMMLFDVYVAQGMHQAFQNKAAGFRLQFSSDSLWQRVQGMGRALDPGNPLYLPPDENISLLPQEGLSLAMPDSKMELVDFVAGELAGIKKDASYIEPGPLNLSVEIPGLLPSAEMGLPRRTGLNMAHFQTEDPALLSVVQHLEKNDLHSACQQLEQLLYHGTAEQRQVSIKWLDILIPLQI
ncbi:type IV pilus assembly protein FimV [Iodobacter ciconiae]|uniref:FimV N-terminal domain-containing protein n=1 Tax=Iodobacter ciconiae TaxID=2496266 RepID=A0A3S8ZTP9_9NEIS|nr:hypothetical protein [Iodobacter ciconiae]AZN36883.1 hypothetical protein EJO50_10560 [Iodobacter ciconiae]